MIRLFGITDRVFTSNGDVVLQPKKAKIRKQDNGSFYLDFEAGLEYADVLSEGRIIVAPTPQGDQAFRIRSPKKTRTKISFQAKHVFYDAENYLIEDSNVVSKNCNDALDHLNRATDTTSPFSTLSDVSTVASFRCVRKALSEAIKEVLERWGGHLVRDNYSIEIRAVIGNDNGVTVRYRKNLKDIEVSEDWSCVVTKLLPTGRDGITLPELYVYSAQQYEIPYTKTVSFSQDIDRDLYKDESGEIDEEAYRDALIADLREQAQNYVNENCIPKVNYTLKANLEKVTDIGDVVEVNDERLGLKIFTNVIAYEYDCISNRYTELEFGNFKEGLSGLLSTISADTQKAVDESAEDLKVTFGAEMAELQEKIWSALGDSHLIYDVDRLLAVDSLPKETARNVIMISAGGISFSNTGIAGPFRSAWTIDNKLNMEAITVLNLTADLIRGGVLKLGSRENGSGRLELYNEQNVLIGEMTKTGLKMYAPDGGYILLNPEVGFAGYDINGEKVYWADGREFHMIKGVVTEELRLFGKATFLPITLVENGVTVNDGIGLIML